MTTTETSNTVKSGVVTGKVPAKQELFFLREIAGDGEHWNDMKKRPSSIAIPVMVLYQWVFALMPANADPLFPIDDVYA